MYLRVGYMCQSAGTMSGIQWVPIWDDQEEQMTKTMQLIQYTKWDERKTRTNFSYFKLYIAFVKTFVTRHERGERHQHNENVPIMTLSKIRC